MSNPNYAKGGGSWSNVTNCYAKHNGSWVEVEKGWRQVQGTWVKFYDKYVCPSTCNQCMQITSWTGTPSSWSDAIEIGWEKATSDGCETLWNGKPYWIGDWSSLSYGANQGYLWFSNASEGIISGGGWLITSGLGSHDTLRPRAYAASGNESCPNTASWSTLSITGQTACSAMLSFYTTSSSVAEGNAGTSIHNVTVNRSVNTSGAVTVNYATANGTATAGDDYTAASGTLSFGAGVTSQTISIAISGDTSIESNETFTITLSNPSSGAVLGNNTVHTVTITNDDSFGGTTTTSEEATSSSSPPTTTSEEATSSSSPPTTTSGGDGP